MSLPEIDEKLHGLLDRQYLGNPLERWLIALAILIGTFLALGILKRIVVARLGAIAAKTETDLDDLLVDMIKRTKRFFLFGVAFYLASHFITWPGADVNADGVVDHKSEIEQFFDKAIQVFFWLQAGFWGGGFVEYVIGRLVRGKNKKEDSSRAMGASVLGFLGLVFVWTIVLLGCIEAVVGHVTSLVASLGVGGIAVALALQNILGDLFASITILLDKPFVVGDSIVLGDFSGTVERIGIKTTRLRSVSGEEIVIGNNDLVSSRVRNFKRMRERRQMFTVGVTYLTPFEKIANIPAILREIVTAAPNTRFDRAHLKTLGDSALVYEVVYYVLSPELNAAMDAQQHVNLEIYKRFEREGIEFALPSQTLYHVMPTGPSSAKDKLAAPV